MRLVTATRPGAKKVGQVSSTRAKWRNMARFFFCLPLPELAQLRHNFCTVFLDLSLLTTVWWKTPFEDAYKVDASSRAFSKTSPTYQASQYRQILDILEPTCIAVRPLAPLAYSEPCLEESEQDRRSTESQTGKEGKKGPSCFSISACTFIRIVHL